MKIFGGRPAFVLALAAAGVMLILVFSALGFGPTLPGDVSTPAPASGPLPGKDQGEAQVRIEVEGSEAGTKKGPPSNDSMTLTVPRLARVDEVPVTTAPAKNERALDAAALHVQGTGFPWERNSNVYIAGHRIGYPGTESNLLFYDLPKLSEGDLVQLTDARGRNYRYKVFRRLTGNPGETAVTRPLPGKRIVSLQTCTLPAYSQRIVVQAKLAGGPPTASKSSAQGGAEDRVIYNDA